MKELKAIINCQIIGYDGLQNIIINQDNFLEKITPISEKITLNNNKLDIKGDYISLGGIDLQINGALGLAFPDLELKDIPKLKEICNYLWLEGIEYFCPTIVTTSLEKYHKSINVINEYLKNNQQQKEAQILGIHLEGPFLNYEKRGAHPAQYLLPLTLENINQVLENNNNLIKIITLAPELTETENIIKYLKSLGITISLGHSLATAEIAKKAFKNGASMITHAFNAMPNLHHRDIGLLGEAIITKNVFCGLICDGIHVNPSMIKILLNACNFEEIFLVSDALSPLGLPDGIYPWDDRKIIIQNGTAKLENGTLSGTTLPLFIGVENLIKWNICDIKTAIKLATKSPREALGLSSEITTGIKANLLRWHWDNQQEKLQWQWI